MSMKLPLEVPRSPFSSTSARSCPRQLWMPMSRRRLESGCQGLACMLHRRKDLAPSVASKALGTSTCTVTASGTAPQAPQMQPTLPHCN